MATKPLAANSSPGLKKVLYVRDDHKGVDENSIRTSTWRDLIRRHRMLSRNPFSRFSMQDT